MTLNTLDFVLVLKKTICIVIKREAIKKEVPNSELQTLSERGGMSSISDGVCNS